MMNLSRLDKLHTSHGPWEDPAFVKIKEQILQICLLTLLTTAEDMSICLSSLYPLDA